MEPNETCKVGMIMTPIIASHILSVQIWLEPLKGFISLGNMCLPCQTKWKKTHFVLKPERQHRLAT